MAKSTSERMELENQLTWGVLIPSSRVLLQTLSGLCDFANDSIKVER